MTSATFSNIDAASFERFGIPDLNAMYPGIPATNV